jgi:hypothetical protein
VADSQIPLSDSAPDSVLQQVEPIVLKNRMAVLTPDPIAEGAFGQVYVGKILNPIGLLAERIVWGEESPRWLGLDDIPFQEARKEEGKSALPTPVMDVSQRSRITSWLMLLRSVGGVYSLKNDRPLRTNQTKSWFLNLP